MKFDVQIRKDVVYTLLNLTPFNGEETHAHFTHRSR